MTKPRIPAGAVVRGTDKGYVHGDVPLKPGHERPVEKFEETYPYMRPRDAATLILVRMKGRMPEVLMGCRAAKSAFMPNRYVFPGGRVDKADAHIPIATPLDRHVKARLLKAASPLRAQALGVAAVRETFEETGLILGRPLKGGEARELPLPTITGLILGEIGRLVKEPPDRRKQRRIPLFVTVHRKHLMLEE